VVVKGAGRLRWFGPFLASRISFKVFVNRSGKVEVAELSTCSHGERWDFIQASQWARGLTDEVRS
jgi:hypothetical protein